MKQFSLNNSIPITSITFTLLLSLTACSTAIEKPDHVIKQKVDTATSESATSSDATANTEGTTSDATETETSPVAQTTPVKAAPAKSTTVAKGDSTKGVATSDDQAPTDDPAKDEAVLTKHADDLELLDSWKKGEYAGNEVFSLAFLKSVLFD